jgi:hypothetical protein
VFDGLVGKIGAGSRRNFGHRRFVSLGFAQCKLRNAGRCFVKLKAELFARLQEQPLNQHSRFF